MHALASLLTSAALLALLRLDSTAYAMCPLNATCTQCTNCDVTKAHAFSLSKTAHGDPPTMKECYLDSANDGVLLSATLYQGDTNLKELVLLASRFASNKKRVIKLNGKSPTYWWISGNGGGQSFSCSVPLPQDQMGGSLDSAPTAYEWDVVVPKGQC